MLSVQNQRYTFYEILHVFNKANISNNIFKNEDIRIKSIKTPMNINEINLLINKYINPIGEYIMFFNQNTTFAHENVLNNMYEEAKKSKNTIIENIILENIGFNWNTDNLKLFQNKNFLNNKLIHKETLIKYIKNIIKDKSINANKLIENFYNNSIKISHLKEYGFIYFSKNITRKE